MVLTRTKEAPSQQRADCQRVTHMATPRVGAEKVHGVLVYQSPCSENILDESPGHTVAKLYTCLCILMVVLSLGWKQS